MQEATYLFLRRIFFWVITFAFVISAPLVVFYSLGYKFDSGEKKFLKTGAISIRTSPWGVSISLNNLKLQDTAPCTLRELLPKTYSILLEKEGYYPYQMTASLKPSQVLELDIVLMPRQKNIEKLKFDFNIYRFFTNKYFLREKIVLFTDQGIYLLDSDFKTIKKISSVDLGVTVAESLKDFKSWNNRLIFWNRSHVWMIEMPMGLEQKENPLVMAYAAQDEIMEVFYGFKDRYFIIRDGFKIIALDAQNTQAFFPIAEVSTSRSEISYDNHSDTIYVRDKVSQNTGFNLINNSFSLFKIELSSILIEKNEKRSPETNP